MPNKEMLSARYPDLLNEQEQADLLGLVSDLDVLYTAPEPPARLTLAGALAQREHAHELRPQRRWLRRFQPAQRFPRRRIGTVAVALALTIVVLTGSVFAYPLLKQVFDPDPGLHQVVNNPLLYQDVNVSQSAGGFTLTVQKAYADANRVILSYTVTKEGDTQVWEPYTATLSTQEGETLRGRGYFIDTSTGAAKFAWFDAGAITRSPQQLQLHLEVDQVYASMVEATPTDGQAAPPAPVHLQQPLVVNFSVPFHPGRIANLHQAVTVNGKTLILERVVVTPSETRAYLRGDGYPLALDSIPMLSVGNWNSSQLSSGSDPGPAAAVWPTDDQWPTSAMLAVDFETSLMDKHGTWTLIVPSLLNPSHDEHSAEIPGPWTFHFVVP